MVAIAGVEFREIWVVDFEFVAAQGELPRPICMVAREILSGTAHQLWEDDLKGARSPPFAIGHDTLYVAYYATAELTCHLALGWPLPERLLDLYTEFRWLTNGRNPSLGNGLLGACQYFGIASIASAQKDAMRCLIIAGGPWSADDRRQILDYCETDVVALAALLEAMRPCLDGPRALLRGREMKAVARIEAAGIPIDMPAYRLLQAQRQRLLAAAIREVNIDLHVYDGLSFREASLSRLVASLGLEWPRLPSGRLKLDEAAFRAMARLDPRLQPLTDVRAFLSQMRLLDFAVGADGRNRAMLRPFSSSTGRSQPSSSAYILGGPRWLRALICPRPGRALAYIDWDQQEWGIAAALSGDPRMLKAYADADPYMAFARQAQGVPDDATRSSHGAVRDLYKRCALGVQYGMGPDSLAAEIGRSTAFATDLIRVHHATYPVFWRWVDRIKAYSGYSGWLHTAYGWRRWYGPSDPPGAIMNFPMQANGSDMMRLAAVFMTDANITLCATLHDAFLIEAAADEIVEVARHAQGQMAAAGALVLGGFQLRSAVQVITETDRLVDLHTDVQWRRVRRLLGDEWTCA